MDDAQRTSTWRDKYKVHPAADVFPMMSDEELAALGADIKANGLTIPVLFWRNGNDRVLIDGRNRLEAMNRVGLDPLEAMTETFTCKDPVTHIISLNIRRRHLTKQHQADLIVAAVKAGADPSPRWRGVTADPVKAAAVATGKAHGISKRTVERAFARATPKPKAVNRSERGHTIMRRTVRPKSGPVYSARGIDAARQHYLRHAELAEDLDAEQEIIVDALRAIDSKRALNGGKPQSPASALPQGGRSEDWFAMTSPTPAPTADTDPEPDFYTDRQLRARWQCSSMKLWRLRRRGFLRAIKVGGTGLNLTPRSEVKAAEAAE